MHATRPLYKVAIYPAHNRCTGVAHGKLCQYRLLYIIILHKKYGTCTYQLSDKFSCPMWVWPAKRLDTGKATLFFFFFFFFKCFASGARMNLGPALKNIKTLRHTYMYVQYMYVTCYGSRSASAGCTTTLHELLTYCASRLA